MTNKINKISTIFSSLLLSLFLASCTQGDRDFIPIVDDPVEEMEAEILITGGAVKGPLINTEINLYKFELDQGLIYQLNNALSVWFELLQSNEVRVIERNSLELGSLTAKNVLENLVNSFEQFGYVTELESLKSVLESQTGFSSASQIVENYIDQLESNTSVANEVKTILQTAATLNELQSKIKNIETLTEKIFKTESFSEAASILNHYLSTETNEQKKEGFKSVLSDLSLLAKKASAFGLSQIKNDFKINTYDIFLSDFSLENDPVAVQNLNILKTKLDSASSVLDAEILIQEGYRKEGNNLIKISLAKLLSKILTINDLHILIGGHQSLYQGFGTKAKIETILETIENSPIPPNETDYLSFLEDISATLINSIDTAFKESLIIKDDDGEPVNRLSFGVSNGQGLLPNLYIGEYRGFLYMEAISSSRTIDLNTGTAPIFKKMESIFHTDDILGNGDNLLEDETIYYLLNGDVQRDSNGKIITDSSLIKNLTNDKLLEVRPSFFATPLTTFAIGLTLEKFQSLFNINSDTDSDLFPENRITESLLKTTLESSSKIVSDTFGIGLSGQNLFKSSPVRLAQMQYSPDKDLQAIQYRLSIENYSSFLYELMSLTNLKDTDLLKMLIEDLNDGQIDGFDKTKAVDVLSELSQLSYLVQIHPSERIIPGTNKSASSIYHLMNNELSTTLPSESINFFPTKNSDVIMISPAGGVDSDSDGVLDNDDQFPFDREKSRDLNVGYAGIWSVNYDNSETAYMPFNHEFDFHFNLEQVVDESCSLLPCIALGDILTPVTAAYSLVSAPKNSDFTYTPYTSSATIGFSAFATVPGDYLVKAVLTTDIVPKQTYTKFIPIHVISPKTIQIKFDPAEPQPGKSISALFKATKGICSLYPICANIDLNDGNDENDFLPLSFLNDIFSIEQKIDRNGKTLSYASVNASGLNQTNADLSNLELKDSVSVIVKFNAGDRSLTAASYQNIVGDNQDSDNDGVSDINDFYPLDGQCSLENDGILDSNLDGEVNSLDSPYCFKLIQGDATLEPLEISFLNETWHYNPKWHFIIRANTSGSGYNGYIKTPTRTGTKQTIQKFEEDFVSKRVYIAYEDGSIDYYSLESQTIQSFSPTYSFNPVHSMNLLGTYLLVEYASDSVVKLFNKNSQLANVHSEAPYPYPGNAITLTIDKQNLLSATNNLINIEWILERESAERDSKGNYIVNQLPVLISNDELTLNSGQTKFGDVVNVKLNFTTDDDRTITLNETIFVLGIESIVFSKPNHDADDPLIIDLINFNSAVLPSDNSSIFVKWYKNNINTEGYTFSLSDKKYPFAFEESNFELGDMIRGDLYIKHGENELKITTLETVILGDFSVLIPKINYELSVVDNTNRTVSVTLLRPLANDKFFNSETITPIWKINEQKVLDETQLYFPSLDSTTFSYGDSISVSYEYDLNGVQYETADFVVGQIEFDQATSKFSLQPLVAEMNQDISLNLSEFTDFALSSIEAKWKINGVIAKAKDVYDVLPEDENEENDFNLFTFPGNKLSYGDKVELLLLPKDADLDRAYTHIATASVGINLESLLNNQLDPENDLDSDNDGVPNHLDYFRYDASCSASSEGVPDDIDFDGVSDLAELSGIIKTNPNILDSDNDGLSDYEERSLSTDPNKTDTDGDGYLDGVEVSLGTDPNDAADPVNSNDDNDFDGLSNGLELLNNTKVNVFDTDKDGLSDWYEINVSTTNPLNSDSDGDKISDGAEIRITLTDPNKIDSDNDGINDGVEIILKLNPNSQDTDNNGVSDFDEPGININVNLPTVLFQNDLENYNNNFSTLLSVKQGTCFKTWLANNKPSIIRNTYNEQQNSSSYQELSFASDKWKQIIRFDAQNMVFVDAIDVDVYNSSTTSISYDTRFSNLLYIGFSDGWVRRYDSLTNTISDVFNTNNELSITTIINQKDILITEQIDSNNQIIHSVFNLNTSAKEPVSSRVMDYSYKNSIWSDSDKLVLISFDENYSESSFIRERFNTSLANPVDSVELINLSDNLKAPLFVEELAGKRHLHFGNGSSYNLSDDVPIQSLISPFGYGFEHKEHRILSQSNSSYLEITTLNELNIGKYWRFNAQLNNENLMALVPVGYHLLAISSTKPTNVSKDNGKISFQSIVLGDENGDTLPDWWNNLSNSLTLSDFENYQLSADALIPDLLDGTPNIDDSLTPPNYMDSDGDNICDHWEVALFNTNPFAADTDSDGLFDSRELSIPASAANDCSVPPRFTVLSDPLKYDSDGDGLSDGDEVLIHFTNPLKPDTDEDGLTDYQELFITITYPDDSNSNGNGDSDNDGLLDFEEINLYKTNHLNEDSDSDGLNDYDEVIIYGTNPNSLDSDGDGLSDFREITELGTDGNSIDTDNDGVSDSDELDNVNFEFTSDPLLPDTDGDGLSDLFERNFVYEYSEEQIALLGELKQKSDPNNQDTDADGICDKWEALTFMSNPAEADSDGDGLSDTVELGMTLPADCTSLPAILPISSHLINDTDGDRILDGDEVLILLTDPRDKDSNDNKINDDLEDPDQDGLNNYQELYQTLTNPLNPDSNNNGKNDGSDDEDGDGLSNLDELNLHGTDPLNPDTDGDGINDKEEIDSKYNPLDIDTDNDGLSDSDEVNIYFTKPDSSDSDGDGSSDYEEVIEKRTDPNNPDTDNDFLLDGADGNHPLNPDFDGDGIPDGIEVHHLGTNPEERDSDGDGLDDGYEAWVFAFAYDSDANLETNTLLKTGVNLDQTFNSNAKAIRWPAPVKFNHNNLDRVVVNLVDVLDPNKIKGRLYIQRYSNPATNDSDGDGLFDATEFEIERVYGVEYTKSLTNDSFKPLETNSVNFKVSDPWNKFTNTNASSDRDSDGDGISDLYETKYTKTDPYNTDTDGDGIIDSLENEDSDLLNNLQEILYGSDPNIFDVNLDTDGDGLLDVFETKLFENYNINSTDSDSDGIADGMEDDDQDLLTNIEEMKFKTDPLTKDFGLDSDGDGLSDYQEINITETDPFKADEDDNGISDDQEDPDNDSITNILELSLGGNPKVFDDVNNIIDTDNDGLTDFQEINLTLTNPLVADSDSNGINDAFEDLDSDGLTNFQEMKLGTDPLVHDSEQLQKHSDNDGLVDIYELKITNTDPLLDDTNFDGILDGQGDADSDGLTDFIEVLLGTNSSTKDMSVDSDNDLLSDTQELLMTLTNPNLTDTDSNGIIDSLEDFDNDGLTNLQEINLLSDPYTAILTDALKDIDNDFYNNLLDQNNNNDISSVINPDQDNDSLPDGLEALLFGTELLSDDSDNDGISDQTEIKNWSYREVGFQDFCLDTEIRLSSVAGKNYCFTVEYVSYPTLEDSDNDGVADRSINNSDNSIVVDHYPLDASCHLSTDGFIKSDLSIQCFSSWMAKEPQIEIIKQAQWVDTSGIEALSHADILFFNSNWDSIVVHNALTSTYDSPINIKEEINAVPVSLIDFEFSKTNKLLYLLYSDSSIESYNVQTKVTQAIGSYSIANELPIGLKILNQDKLLLQTVNQANRFNYRLLENTGAVLDSFEDQVLNTADSISVCYNENNDCNDSVSIFGFIENSESSNVDLGRLDIDFINDNFISDVQMTNILGIDDELQGPIKLSQSGDLIQLGSGQVFNLLLENAGTTLSREHNNKSYSTYYDFVEYADHFVGVIDVDLSGVPGSGSVPYTQNGLIVTELNSIKDTLKQKLPGDDSINDLKELNQYSLPPNKLDEQILKLIPFTKIPSYEIAIVKKSNDKIVIDPLGLFDADNDLMTGLFEKIFGLDDTNSEDKFTDLDFDGLSNIEEYFFATDPTNQDSDGDGWLDIHEILNGTDPNNNLSY